ncbi:ABC transporter permease [Mucilaginibacter sp. X5P1]|uniref:ABC transporter permease n=1 Tax=Mucilaginibacter sp. X5P1 TaxID=2723088 RepID=UPI001619DB72|nr:ABC transporter permease [Mucilaginibacter sp. X5P1]MBB6138386.1 ABC-2 type transport system permease protein [Mucilaginibacter sp. X5P1]
MKKVLLIIQREYLVRVRKKSFILMIFLVPMLILTMFAIIYLIATYSDDLNKERTIWVIDQSHIFTGKFHNKKNIVFESTQKSITDAKADLRKHEDDFLLVIPENYNQPDAVEISSEKKPNFTIAGEIQDQMNDIATNTIMVKQGIDTAKLHAIKSDISISAKQITDKGEESSSIGAAYGAGIAGAILVYLALFIYGAQVMRGVIEEKTSRIIEVIISSVKPFQLMLGKIIGVGLVGLTQFILWIILSTGVTFIAGNFLLQNKAIPQKEHPKTNQTIKTQTTSDTPSITTQSPAIEAYNSFKTVNFPYILGCFLFYFLSGFFLYSALFAAVGSAVDSETETQQFMFPITLPLLFTYILSFSFLINNPDSTLAVWLSIIPFTAPVAMMVRVPFGVPGWQMALSMLMMVIGFLFTTYIASRVYRVGILMYGKKASYKELVKWFFYKE